MSNLILRNKLNSIVREYLFNISSLKNHNHFQKAGKQDSREQYFHSKGFRVLLKNKDNEYVVDEEHFLEGCTRVFLVNPIIKALLDHYEVKSDWRYGTTFSDQFHLPNREYESDAYLEFIIEHRGKRIGCRYTRNSYSLAEADIMQKHTDYQFNRTPVPGFDVLSPIDEVWAIDWSGITDIELASIHPTPKGMKSLSRDISITTFILEVLSAENYDLFVSTIQHAIYEAQRIIALKAVPQLLPNNMLTFKDAIMDGFSESELSKLSYQFKPGATPAANTLSANDITAIKKAFFDSGYKYAIVGNSDFAKSFITSEYLYRSISEGLGIDYTAVVVGYLKSVEQLMQLLYVSAFQGNTRMQYWDVCRRNKLNYFDITLPQQYRLDPYNPIASRKQEYFYHNIRVGDDAMEFGGLALFLRYYQQMWNVSEAGKEYIFACLDDYRDSCRNSHFHKDNISYSEYATVQRIRDNTYVLLHYLLGAFKLLDTRTTDLDQLDVLDYSFDRLYQSIWQKRRQVFWIKICSGYKGIIGYLNQGDLAIFDEAGRLKQTALSFVMFPGISRDEATAKDLNALRNDSDYIRDNTIVITRDTAIEHIEPFLPKRKR